MKDGSSRRVQERKGRVRGRKGEGRAERRTKERGRDAALDSGAVVDRCTARHRDRNRSAANRVAKEESDAEKGVGGKKRGDLLEKAARWPCDSSEPRVSP